MKSGQILGIFFGFALVGATPIMGQADGPREMLCPRISVKKREIKFDPGQTRLRVSSKIELCTDHYYKVNWKQGQRVKLHFDATRALLLAIFDPQGDAIFGTTKPSELVSSFFDWEGPVSL